jgi:hypothetical protein
MKEYFNIENKLVINDLKMIINSKKYEIIVKSIKYFFDNFLNKKLILPKNIDLSRMDLKILKNTLNELKKTNIYDYETNSPYYKVFISFYEKKEALDFLMRNIKTNKKSNDQNFTELRKKLIYKLDPTNRSISIKDINDTIKSLQIFNSIIDLDAHAIINSMQLLTKEEIETIENFSIKFGSIIE